MAADNPASPPDPRSAGETDGPLPAADGPSFAFVIPVYNHGGTVGDVARKARARGFPVFVVDDGSTDSTGEAVAGLDGVSVLRHPANRGKGAALLTGLAAAARVAGFAITVDADGQHDPGDADALIDALPPDARPVVVGRREGMEGTGVPWTSRFGRRFSNFWVRVSGGPRLSDSQSGFRIYPLPETLQLGARARRFQFEVEILALAGWAGIPVLEAPIRVAYAPGSGRVSHFRPFVGFWRNALTFTRLILMRIFIPRAVRARLRTGR